MDKSIFAHPRLPLEQRVCFLALLQVGFIPWAVLICIPSSRWMWAASALCHQEELKLIFIRAGTCPGLGPLVQPAVLGKDAKGICDGSFWEGRSPSDFVILV